MLSHSCLLPSEVSLSVLPPVQHLYFCVSSVYEIKMSTFMALFPPQIWSSASVSSQLFKQEKGIILFSHHFFSGSFCTTNELSNPIIIKNFINFPFFLIFTVIAFAQVLTIICLDYCLEELDGLASSLLPSQIFLTLELLYFFLLYIFLKKIL